MEQARHLVEQLCDHRREAAFPGGLSDGDMKRRVGFEEARDALYIVRLIAMPACFIEHTQSLGVDFARRHARRGRLQHQAQLEHVLDVFQRNRSDPVAAARYRAQQSIMGEADQRHAHRCLAEAIVRAQLRLGNFGAGRDRARDDVVLDPLVRAVGQQGNGWRGRLADDWEGE